jgi:CMP-N-acetylneuraminic acid synthetase
MKILGVIPARGGSKGIKDKNIKQLGGKPLIAWTIQAASLSKLDRYIVSTDSELIADISKKFKADVPFIRPWELATDSARAIPVLQHALSFLFNIGEKYDAVMMLQPTSPFRSLEDIDKAIEILSSTNADSVISVVDVEGHHPARMKFLDDNGFLIDPIFCENYENQPRHELEKIYIRNGAIYLTRTNILKNNTLKGSKSFGLVMPQIRSINIDNNIDFDFAEFIYEKYLVNNNEHLAS